MRLEIPLSRTSWVIEGCVVIETIGEHSVDTNWPWFDAAERLNEPVGQLVLPIEDDDEKTLARGDQEATIRSTGSTAFVARRYVTDERR